VKCWWDTSTGRDEDEDEDEDEAHVLQVRLIHYTIPHFNTI